MIVVVGSRHDAVAGELIAAWPGSRLCSAEDVTCAGWSSSPTGSAPLHWVVDGQVVPDQDITGVFVRRSSFYVEELTSTHREDRAYLVAEAHAFLADVLGSTRAAVATPVRDGAFGDEVLRPELWMAAAVDAGLTVKPVRLRSSGRDVQQTALHRVEVVRAEVFGECPEPARRRLAAMCASLGLWWATFVLDRRHRIVTVTTAEAPSADARAALAAALGGATP